MWWQTGLQKNDGVANGYAMNPGVLLTWHVILFLIIVRIHKCYIIVNKMQCVFATSLQFVQFYMIVAVGIK